MRAFRVAYDGTHYHGFQRQPEVSTVEDAILDGFHALGVDPLGAEGTYAAAGRTDAGVSALEQTIVAQCPAWLSAAALNSELPDDIWVWATADVDESFHPRYGAAERSYTYYLYTGDLDIARARIAARHLEGTITAAALTADAPESDRTVTEVRVETEGMWGEVTVKAPGFLREQVRRMVTVIRLVGRGDRPPSFVNDVLGDGAPDGIMPAPPEPLLLREVAYPGVEFVRDGKICVRALEHFAGEARVAGGYGGVLWALHDSFSDEDTS